MVFRIDKIRIFPALTANAKSAALLILMLSAVLSGCTADYTKHLVKKGLQDSYVLNTPELTYTRQWVLPSSSSLYVAFPKGPWSVPLRRKMTSDLAMAMNQHFVNIEFTNDETSLPEALYTAKILKANYVVYPQLALYTNKLSSYVEIDEDLEDYRQIGFDRFVLLLKLYDTNSEKLIDVTQINARSGLLSIERSTPSALFSNAFVAYAQSLIMKNVN